MTRRVFFVAAIAVVTLSRASLLPAQGSIGGSAPALVRAMDFEQRGHNREAVAAFHEALGGADYLAALLGMERVYAAMSESDSMIPVADSVARAHPSEVLAQVVRLRVLLYARRPAAANAAFVEWIRRTPTQITPYREFARLLLDAGKLASADSVITAARRLPGGDRALAVERARVQSARGEWALAAGSWRGAVENGPHLAAEAAFALGEATGTPRDDIRFTLAAAPTSAPARALLSQLEMMWGSAAAAWGALAPLNADGPTVSAWREFGEHAEAAEAWLPARDAWRAVLAATKCDPETALRAADDAVRGGDALGALAVLDASTCAAETTGTSRVAGALRVRALALAGRAPEAAELLARLAMSDEQRRILTTDVAWAWVRAGETAKARALMGDALADDTTGVRGWLALYEGDVATARVALRESRTPSRDAVRAQAIIARTRADRAPRLGAAFLALAQNDSAHAAELFESAAAELPDAAPALLASAAEIRSAHGEQVAAIGLWQRIVADFEQSADAPPAELALARALLARGDRAGARAHAEHLILTYQASALVPQARRLLETMGASE